MSEHKQDIVDYLQEIAGLDTEREGDIVKVEISLHSDFDLIVWPSDGEAAYFKFGESGDAGDDVLWRVEAPKGD